MIKIKKIVFDLTFKILYTINPKISAKMFYRYIHKEKRLDFSNLRTAEEKNIWLALNSNTEIWSELSDKYAVRSYVEKCGDKRILTQLYGRWENAEEIDFDKLPRRFVLKTNNGCGTVLIVDKESSNFNGNEIKQTLNSWLKKKYGYVGYNGHYLRIKPCIIAEELLLENDSSDILPKDYKFFCTKGKPHIVEVCAGRQVGGHNIYGAFFDMDWKLLHEGGNLDKREPIKKPVAFDEMVDLCQTLAGNFKFVRVDFYEISGKVYFGELTFTPGFGSFSDEMNTHLGKMIEL